MSTAKYVHKILIVEDDLSLKPFWEFILEKHFLSYQMDWAVDSESAKLLYMHAVKKGENYSLIVLDLFISGPETGLDLVHFLDVLGDRSLTLLVSNVDEGELKIQTADLKLWLEVIGKPLNVPRLDRILDTAEVMQR